MKTMENALLDHMENEGIVEWKFTDRTGKPWHKLATGNPPLATCYLRSNGRMLVELRWHNGGYEPNGSDIITGKDLREIPKTEHPREVEIPLHYLRSLNA